MKRSLKVLLLVTALAHGSHSQNVNWRSLGDAGHNIVQINAGYDYGATAQIGYARSFVLVSPVIAGLDFTLLMGRDLSDDFKIRLGAQIEIVHIEGFSATIKIYGNFRRYQTQLVRIVSFGSDFAVLAGYYSSTWYAAGEFGFDKAIATALKHSDIMRAYFPAIRDGWYVPTGGNYYYGIQGGKTLGESLEMTVRVGATRAQDHDESPVIPRYVQLGFSVRF
jgi:hypothetical protein